MVTNDEIDRLLEGDDIVAMALAASGRYVDAMRRDLDPRCCEAWRNATQTCLTSLKINLDVETTDPRKCRRIINAMDQVLKDVGEARAFAERRIGLMLRETENEAGKT